MNRWDKGDQVSVSLVTDLTNSKGVCKAVLLKSD